MTEAGTLPLTVATVEAVEDPTFDDAMESEIKGILKRYPDHDAALLPILWLCQERWGWISSSIL